MSIEKPIIPLLQLREGVSDFNYTLSSGQLEFEESCLRNPIEVKVEVSSVEEDYYITLNLSTQAIFECDRCGETFKAPLKETLRSFFTRDPDKVSAEDDDVRWLPPDAVSIDLTQDIRDALALAIPGKRLCREECKGLCPICGINWNDKTCSCKQDETDPRWDALKKLRFDKK